MNGSWWLVLAACAMDRLIGDPRRWVHPVQLMGWAINTLRPIAEAWAGNQPRRLRWAGVGITLLLVGGSGLAGWALERVAMTLPVPGLILLVIALASSLAGRSLEQAVREVLQALPDLPQARVRLSWIVGRSVTDLPQSEILRAAAETASENAVDGLFAPLFWMLVGAWMWERWPAMPGPLALAWAFKASSTLDSMLGYRVGKLRWLGTAGARLDDVLTWLPCRLTALTLPLVSGHWRQMLAPVQGIVPRRRP
jgi:adenosylcobinamide-phosphate synthase